MAIPNPPSLITDHAYYTHCSRIRFTFHPSQMQTTVSRTKNVRRLTRNQQHAHVSALTPDRSWRHSTVHLIHFAFGTPGIYALPFTSESVRLIEPSNRLCRPVALGPLAFESDS